MAVPRKKVSHSKKGHRLGGITRNRIRKMGKFLNLVKCDNCGKMKRNHVICPECNTYNKRTYTKRFSKKTENTKVIKA